MTSDAKERVLRWWRKSEYIIAKKLAIALVGGVVVIIVGVALTVHFAVSTLMTYPREILVHI